MASLKEIKGRINSVNSTGKITSAMKMIASAKLHKAQSAIQNFLPYQEKLDAILTNLLSSDTSYDSPFTQQREVKRSAILAISSNTTLCGAFNANVMKEFKATYASKVQALGKDNVEVYAIGKQIAEYARKNEITSIDGDHKEIADIPAYTPVQELAKNLIDKYIAKELDEIILIFHHFKSTGSQILMNATYLPFDLKAKSEDAADDAAPHKDETAFADYIYEPSKVEILDSLIPTVLYSRMFAALLDSNASEHAARMVAMQVASDNAAELIQDLNIQYNKTRQFAVTSELLDIMGGVSALQ